MIRLYDYWRSSAAYRLRIALKLSGEDYEREQVDLLSGAHKSPENLTRNPQGLVPTLEIDGHTLTQSISILEYLSETREMGLLADDAAGRARVRALTYAIAMEIHPVCNLSVARFATDHAPELEMQDWMQAFIPRGLAAVEIMLSSAQTGLFCHGDTVSMADICLVPQIYNARRWDIELTPMPTIRRIVDRLEEIPAFAAAHPDRIGPP